MEIEDINDNNPEFERESYTADISETAPPGKIWIWPGIFFYGRKIYLFANKFWDNINIEKPCYLRIQIFSIFYMVVNDGKKSFDCKNIFTKNF